MPVPIKTYVFVLCNITDPSIKLVGPCRAIRRLRRLVAQPVFGPNHQPADAAPNYYT
jgi:hypothetical protein